MLNLLEFTNTNGADLFPTDLTLLELRRWLAVRLHLALVKPRTLAAFWSGKHQSCKFMSRDRFAAVNRALWFEDPRRAPKNAPWYWNAKYIVDIVRECCLKYAAPSSWQACDEFSLKFQARCAHTVKMPNKPAKEGFRIWGIANPGGYLHYFFLHSAEEGVKDYAKGRRFNGICYSPTTIVAHTFCEKPQELWPRKYLAVLDDWFTSVKLAHRLRKINVAILGTAKAVSHRAQLECIAALGR